MRLSNKTGFEIQFVKNATDFLEGQGRVIGLEKDEVVEGIDFVAKASNGPELQIKAHQLIRGADAGSVDLQFDHEHSFGSGERRGKNQVGWNKPWIAPGTGGG
jgi:hypothetical protein